MVRSRAQRGVSNHEVATAPAALVLRDAYRRKRDDTLLRMRADY